MTSDQTEGERRRHTRVDFRADARLSADATAWPCELLNVSIKGALLTRPENFPGGDGDRCLLSIALDGGAAVEMEVNVVRVEQEKIACDWDMFDVAGFVQLRKMLERQLKDPKLVERELNFFDEMADRSE